MIDTTPSAVVDNAQIYTDLNGVEQLKALGKTDKGAALKQIAHQFEAMMVQMMMKSMREANEAFSDGDITSSSDTKFYQSMFDNQLSLTLSQGRGFGIAEALMRQFRGRFESDGKSSAAGSDAGAATSAKTVDHDVTTLRRVQTLVDSAVQGGADSPRITAAIQDALHTLFGGEHESADGAAGATANAFDGSPSNFIESLRPLAQRVAASLGVDSDVVLSQAALETGWGQKILQCADGSSSFNFFNIKADDSWNGPVVKVPTLEYQDGVAVREWAKFRAYGSPEESFADYARLVSENPRYRQAVRCADDPRAYIKALAAAGYATDPNYAGKVLALYDGAQMRGGQTDVAQTDSAAAATSVR